MTDRPVSGKWFEELTEGLVIQHVIRRTITEADNVSFTTMTMNPAWLHSTPTTPPTRPSSGNRS